MASCASIYVQSFIKIGSSFQKLIGRINRQTDTHTHTHTHTHAHRQQLDLISLLYFFKIRKSSLKIE
jgi:hypothetical protein